MRIMFINILKNVINKIKLLNAKSLAVTGDGIFACECIDCHGLFFGISRYDSKCPTCRHNI
jgi:hypothetical protein